MECGEPPPAAEHSVQRVFRDQSVFPVQTSEVSHSYLQSCGSATQRNLLGSRKRKAYLPRNSGLDVTPPCSSTSPATATPRPPKRRALAKDSSAVPEQPAQPDPAPTSPPAASSKARSFCDRDSDRAATSETAAPAVESLAASRSRRNIKPREKFDPRTFDLSADFEEAGDSRSDGSSDTQPQCPQTRRGDSCSRPLARAPKLDSASTAVAAASPRAWLNALVATTARSGGRGGDAGRGSGASDEQRMFQEFRKRTCTAYTGVVVHCQNMKLEARVNMVSYFPQRERKISGGQIYIAYMTNPHQAAVVHDITASIMTAPGIHIFHNHHSRSTTNREVALERLNYLDTLEVNMHRGFSRHNDKDQMLEKKARLDAENRRQVMLSPEELKRELHCWVSHEARWMTFKAWIEDVLFESKLANMCLKPKVIDDEYLKPDERDLLKRFLPEYSMSNPPVFTHMYDTLVMDKVSASDGSATGYKLRSKRYRRRKPEMRNGAIKWFDDKSYRFDLEDAATAEDQQRLDIAWAVVQTWLRHYDPALQGPPPEYDAVDANYYVTWSHFAEWVNTLLEHLPGEIAALTAEAGSAQERPASTRRSARTSDSDDRVERLQAVLDKFRAVVAEGERMPSTWSDAQPQHRQAFENFFSGWKPLPPSMSQPQRKVLGRGASEGPARASTRRAAAATKAEEAPVTRSLMATRARSHAQQKQSNSSSVEAQPEQAKTQPHCSGNATACTGTATLFKASQQHCSTEAHASAQHISTASPPVAAPVQQQPTQDEGCGEAARMAHISDVERLRAWAVLNGLGQAVPVAAQQQQVQLEKQQQQQQQQQEAIRKHLETQSSESSRAAQVQQLMQLQMQIGYAAGQGNSEVAHPSMEPFTSPQVPHVPSSKSLSDAIATLSVPPQLFARPTPGHDAVLPSHPAPPRAFALPPSPFMTSVDIPLHHSGLPTAGSLITGQPGISLHLDTCKGQDPSSCSINDSARSCLTAAGSTPTALDRPTLSRLLSNPMFALPSAANSAPPEGHRYCAVSHAHGST